jgi:hypothetical protein
MTPTLVWENSGLKRTYREESERECPYFTRRRTKIMSRVARTRRRTARPRRREPSELDYRNEELYSRTPRYSIAKPGIKVTLCKNHGNCHPDDASAFLSPGPTMFRPHRSTTCAARLPSMIHWIVRAFGNLGNPVSRMGLITQFSVKPLRCKLACR